MIVAVLRADIFTGTGPSISNPSNKYLALGKSPAGPCNTHTHKGEQNQAAAAHAGLVNSQHLPLQPFIRFCVGYTSEAERRSYLQGKPESRSRGHAADRRAAWGPHLLGLAGTGFFLYSAQHGAGLSPQLPGAFLHLLT